jgi:rSAM/selenodomain-associated transferase 2
MLSSRISVIIPVLNEEHTLAATLATLQSMRGAGHEVIVVDGGSTDRSVAIAQTGADRVFGAERGRACQMNAGAQRAAGGRLLFLHADTVLPPRADVLVESSLQHHDWGRFDVRLSGNHPLLRVVETTMNWRSRLTGIATGDHAMFMTRSAFMAVGGFPPVALMEDVALSKLLRTVYGRPACIAVTVLASSRRWVRHGIVRTIFKMWCLRLAYAAGISPAVLARYYD